MGSNFRNIRYKTLMDAFSSVGVGFPAMENKDFSNIAYMVVGDASCDKDCRFQGSIAREEPTFLGSTGTLDDEWDYTETYDANTSAAALPGDTSITIAGAAVRIFRFNSVEYTYSNFRVLVNRGGTITVKSIAINNT